MSGTGDAKGSREQEVSTISRSLKAIAKDPADRFPDAKALADAVDAGVTATNPAERAKPPRPRTRQANEIRFWGFTELFRDIPAEALARNMPPRKQLDSLLDGAGVSRDQIVTVARPGGAALYRFEVIHVVRPQRDQPLLFRSPVDEQRAGESQRVDGDAFRVLAQARYQQHPIPSDE